MTGQRAEEEMAKTAIRGMTSLVEASFNPDLESGRPGGQGSNTKFGSDHPSQELLVGTGMPARRYRHVRNAVGGVDSLCLKCGSIIASVNNEWSLLDYEQRHICAQ